jgi:hypothetical protein
MSAVGSEGRVITFSRRAWLKGNQRENCENAVTGRAQGQLPAPLGHRRPANVTAHPAIAQQAYALMTRLEATVSR